MAQNMAHKNPLCKMGLVANSVLFFCIEHTDFDIMTAYNVWRKKSGKNFVLDGDETAFTLSLFENFLFQTTSEQRNILKDIEMRNMSPDEVNVCLGR